MEKKFCPFINGICRDDCVFKYHKVANQTGIHDCLIAIKLTDINEMQHDDLSAIWSLLKRN